MKNALLLSLVIILSTCSSINLDPPSSEFVNEVKKEIEEGNISFKKEIKTNQRWIKTYLWAKAFQKRKQFEKSCLEYKELSVDKNFPLQKLAFINTFSVCSWTKESLLKAISKIDLKNERWLDELLYEKLLTASKNLKINDLAMDSIFILTEHKKKQRDKIRLINSSIEYFENDPELKKKLIKLRESVAPRFITKISKNNRLTVANDLSQNREFLKARKIYKSIISDKQSLLEEKMEAYKKIIKSFKLQRDRNNYAAWLRKQTTFLKKEHYKNKSHSIQDLIWANRISEARGAWTRHNNTLAKKILNNLLKETPASPDKLINAYSVMAGVYQEEGKREKSNEFYQKSIQLKIKDNKLMEKLLWMYGWNLYQMKKYNKSFQILDKLKDLTESRFTKAKVNYWLGKIYQKNNEIEKATNLWRETSKNNTFEYYGILSTMELKEKFTLYPKSLPQDEIADFTFKWLLALDEQKLGKKYIQDNKENIQKNTSLLSYFKMCNQVGWYLGGIIGYYQLPKEQQLDLEYSSIPYLFPTPYKKEIEKRSKKNKVDQFLIYSLIRQESAFDKEARSAADAYGLMQIIPGQGRKLSKRYKVSYNGFESLYDIDINLELGIALLKELLRKFKGNYMFTLASYNADIRVILKWKKYRFKGDYVEFIENIPYNETRKYIKLIIRNYVNYKRLLGNKPFHFPKEFFKTF